jgi:hypothetical protein
MVQFACIIYLFMRLPNRTPAPDSHGTISVDDIIETSMNIKDKVDGYPNDYLMLLSAQNNKRENGVYRVYNGYLIPVFIMPLTIVYVVSNNRMHLIHRDRTGTSDVQDLSYSLLKPPEFQDAELECKGGEITWIVKE